MTSRKRSLGQGNVFTQIFVSLLTGGGGLPLDRDAAPLPGRPLPLQECILVSQII